MSLYKNKEKYIDDLIKGLEKGVLTMQDRLTAMILMDFANELDYKGGKLKATMSNMTLISRMDTVFEKFDKEIQGDILDKYAKRMVKITDLNSEYYASLGFKNDLIDKIKSK